MLKKQSILSLISVFCLSAALIGEVQKASAELFPKPVWDGAWFSTTGDVTIFISEKDGFVDVIGKDAKSSFSCTGVVEGTMLLKKDQQNVTESVVECNGSGIKADKRFIYKSKLKLTARSWSQVIELNWEMKFADGKKTTDKSRFSNVKPDESER